jgi:hypothetical protein
MENKGLLFIPDISGFTRFVTDMEIEHSRHIIQELLEILIDSNHLGLEVSEVEGDAILFYKFGKSPELKELYGQVETMFCAFHRHLMAYDQRRICQCKACNSAVALSLKVITHYGEFTGYNVKNFHKLIGKDVIVAHQLLKNDIRQHEYWLVTKDLLGDRAPLGLKDWMEWKANTKETESGKISFHYTQIGDLKKEIKPESLPDFGIRDKSKILSETREYDTDIKKLFYTVVHFEFRNQWMEGIRGVDEVEHFLPGVGTRHRCIADLGAMVMYTSDFSYDPEGKIIYSETDEKKLTTTYFILEKTGPRQTRFTIEFYLRNNPVVKLVFGLFMKKKVGRMFRRSLLNLEQLVRKVEVPVEF